jgi:hypothetical protein
MFIGHYGVSFAAKRFTPRTSLGTLFFAVQLLDVLFAIFVLAGVEKLRIVPGFTQYNPYDLYYMPYSHSLAGSLVWSAAAGLVVLAVSGQGAALWIALAVFSHFLLDVPMHTRDLPLVGNDSMKIGLGLWQHRNVALAAELVTLGIGLWIWRHATTIEPWRRTRTLVFAGFLFAVAMATPFLPAPRDGTAFAWQALVGYVLLAAIAGWLDRGATATNSPRSAA